MAQWQVARVTPIAPTDFEACDAAYLLTLSDQQDERRCVVEFEAPSSVASGGYAEEALRPYLGNDEPPRALRVDRAGAVHVVEGPLDADPDRRPSALRPPEPLRARRRGRR